VNFLEHTTVQDMPQLRWLVTGCSSGLGETFVRSILARGDKVVATARGDPERLSSLKEVGAETLSLDVTASPSKIQAVVSKIRESGPIDVLVNNAGYIEAGLAEEARYELCEMLDWSTNSLEPQLCKPYGPTRDELLRRPEGHAGGSSTLPREEGRNHRVHEFSRRYRRIAWCCPGAFRI
jgi:NAD(P)-dependent dehydrogenase (short-subunit alcohol dehydrogenase family)